MCAAAFLTTHQTAPDPTFVCLSSSCSVYLSLRVCEGVCILPLPPSPSPSPRSSCVSRVSSPPACKSKCRRSSSRACVRAGTAHVFHSIGRPGGAGIPPPASTPPSPNLSAPTRVPDSRLSRGTLHAPLKSLSALRPRQQSFPRPVDVTKRSPRHERSEKQRKNFSIRERRRPSTPQKHERAPRQRWTSLVDLPNSPCPCLPRPRLLPARGSQGEASRAVASESDILLRICFFLCPTPSSCPFFPIPIPLFFPPSPSPLGNRRGGERRRRRGGERRKGGRQRPRRIQTKNSHPPGGPKRKKTLPQKSER